MASLALKFYLYDALVNSWQKLDEAATGAATTAGWITSTGTTNRSEWASGTAATTERAASTFDATTYPDGSLNTTIFDAWRTNSTYTGTFTSANWVVQGSVRAVTNNGGTMTGVLYVRLFRSANTDGSGAVEITSAAQASATSGVIGTGADTNVTVTFNPGAFSVTNEYLYFQIAWGRVGAGGMTSSDVHMRTGSAAGTGTQIDTAPFIVGKVTSDTLPASLTDETQSKWMTTWSDSLTIGLSDGSSVCQRLTTADSPAIGLTEESSLSYSPRAALVSILTQLQNYGIPGRRYGSFSGRATGGPTTVDTADTLVLGMTEDGQNLFAQLTREESIVCGLTEDRVLLALLAREDTAQIGLSELASLALAIATSDTLAVGLVDATQTLTSFVNRDDTLVVGLTDSSATFVVVNRDDANAIGLTDSSDVRALLNRDDSLAIILSESSVLDAGGVINVASADTLVVGLVDAFTNILTRVDTSDVLALVWQEDSQILAKVNRDDSLPLGLSETSQLAVNINSAGDTLRIGLADDSQTFVTVTSADAVQAILAEASTVFAQLNTDDTIQAQLTDATMNILALLQREDAPALVVIDTATPLVPLTGADALAIGTTESGQAVEVFLNRLGPVLVATVLNLSGDYTTRFVRQFGKTVRYLGNILSVRVL